MILLSRAGMAILLVTMAGCSASPTTSWTEYDPDFLAEIREASAPKSPPVAPVPAEQIEESPPPESITLPSEHQYARVLVSFFSKVETQYGPLRFHKHDGLMTVAQMHVERLARDGPRTYLDARSGRERMDLSVTTRGESIYDLTKQIDPYRGRKAHGYAFTLCLLKQNQPIPVNDLPGEFFADATARRNICTLGDFESLLDRLPPSGKRQASKALGLGVTRDGQDQFWYLLLTDIPPG